MYFIHTKPRKEYLRTFQKYLLKTAVYEDSRKGNVELVVIEEKDLRRSPFMCSRSHYQCSCVKLINQISAEAVMWLLLCGCVNVT